jgi:aminoglycoside phosphotransferase (APT) family kinase protein
MPEEQPARQVCALLHDGRVLTDDAGRLPARDDDGSLGSQLSLTDRAGLAGDPGAVLVAPQVRVSADPPVLLNVFSPRESPTGAGAWTDLDELVHDDEEVVAALRDLAQVAAGVRPPPDRRPDWYRTTWYDEVEDWVDRCLADLGRVRSGPAEPIQLWSISAVVRIPSEPAAVWFKAACPHFHAEPALTRLVAEIVPEHAPEVIATDDARAWLLLEEMAGAEDDDADPPPGLGPAAARIAATTQLRSLDHLPEVRAAGVPVRSLAATLTAFDQILAGSVELDLLTTAELDAARSRRHAVHALVDELGSLGIPDTLVHGDLHPGNVAHDGDSLVLYDWSDASISHPFFDAVQLVSRLPEKERPATRDAYAEAWQAAYPALDVERALELAAAANLVYQLVTYEQISRAQGEESSWEMRGVIARMLRTLPDLFPPRS